MDARAILLAVVVLASGAVQTLAEIEIAFNEIHQVPQSSYAGYLPGRTDLTPFMRLQGDALVDLVQRMNDHTAHPMGGAAAYRYAAATHGLDGRLSVEVYKAYDYQQGLSRWHGAGLVADYDPSPDDPTGLVWVQAFDELGDADYFSTLYAAPGWILDGFEDANPAYYWPGDLNGEGGLADSWRAGLPIGPTQPIELDPLTLIDYPRYPHDALGPWAGGYRFCSLLASAQQNTDPTTAAPVWDVTIYEAVSWGYDGLCIPEPSMVLLLLTGALVGVRILDAMRGRG